MKIFFATLPFLILMTSQSVYAFKGRSQVIAPVGSTVLYQSNAWQKSTSRALDRYRIQQKESELKSLYGQTYQEIRCFSIRGEYSFSYGVLCYGKSEF